MKQLILLSIVLLAATFLLPFLNLPSQPLLPPGQAAEPSAGTPTHLDLPTPTSDTIPASTPPAATLHVSDSNTLLQVQIAGENVELSLAEYLLGVLAGEIPPTFPGEAIRAQAVAARSFALYELEHPAADNRHPDSALCDDPAHCQAYVAPHQALENWGSFGAQYIKILEQAIVDTNSQVITYEDKPILAVFYSTSSGYTEKASDVWGADMPYLQSVASPGEEEAPAYQGRVEITRTDFWNIFKGEFPEANPSQTPFGEIERSPAGGILTIEICGVTVTGSTVRQLYGLNSTNFIVGLSGDHVVFETKGFGHGVGLSQYGARAMAMEGRSYQDILAWYYTSTDLVLYDPATKTVSALPGDEPGEDVAA